MSAPVVVSPDVELAVVTWAGTALAGHGVSPEAPDDLAAQLPFHRVTVLPAGQQSTPTFSTVLLDVDSWGGSRLLANRAALDFKDALEAARNVTIPAQGIAFSYLSGSAPSWRPWDNTNVRRVGALFTLSVHAIPIS